MKRPESKERMRHMLDHAREAVAGVVGKKRDDFDNDRFLVLALVQLMQIIGEAASRVEQKTRKQHPNIPWPQIIGLRNRLIHGYDTVDLDVLWEILANDVPDLITELESIEELENETP